MPHSPTKTCYGGRFRFDLPVAYTLRGEGGFVRDVEIRDVKLPVAPSSEAARDLFWTKHVAEVRDQYREHKLPPILDERELRPGVPRLSYRGYDEDDLVLEALPSSQGRAVLIRALWRQSYKPAARPTENAEREQAFDEVVKAFSFLPVGYVAPDPDAFYVKDGLVRIPYSASGLEHQERFEVGYDAAAHHVKLDFEYEYIEAQPRDKQPGFLERVARTMAQWPFVGSSLRSGRRVVAGFAGEESLLHVRDDHKVTYGWMYEPAKNLAGFQPTITITAESDDGDIAVTTALWDQTLAGIRRLAE